MMYIALMLLAFHGFPHDFFKKPVFQTMQVSAPAAAAVQPQMTDALVPNMHMQNQAELLASRALSSLLAMVPFPVAGATYPAAKPNPLALVMPPTQVPPEVASATAAKDVKEVTPLPLQNDESTLPTKAEIPGPAPKNEEHEESLEDFEQAAFDALQKRTAAKGMKRPAAAKASAKAGAKVSAAAPKQKAKGLKLGCKKCRGAKAGCEQCRNSAYTGQRLTREEWKSLAKKTGLK